MEHRTRAGTGKEIVKFIKGEKPMTKTVNPILSLAVVMALALAAVFGAMSLTGTAQAAVDQSAGTELTERTFSPQAAAPAGLRVQSVGSQTITFELDWDTDSPALADYRVSWRINSPNRSFTDPQVVGSDDGVTGQIGTATTKTTITVDGTVGSITDPGLNNDLEYEFEVSTVVSGASSMAAPIKATPQAPPAGIISADSATVPAETRGRIEIKWTYAPTADTANVADWEYTLDSTVASPEWKSTGRAGNGPHIYVIENVPGDVVGGSGTAYPNIALRAVAAPVSSGQPGANATITSANIATDGAALVVFEASALRMPPNVDAVGGDAEITVSWDLVENAGSYEVTVKDNGVEVESRTVSASPTTVDGLKNNVTYDVEVVAKPRPSDLVNADSMAGTAFARTVPDAVIPVNKELPKFTQSSDDPGDSATYTVEFQMEESENTRREELVIEFHEDYGIPSSIRNTSVAITTKEGKRFANEGAPTPTNYTGDVTFTPEDVTVDGEKVIISLGDMDERDQLSDYELSKGETVTVHFRQSAGITTPTEAKTDGYNLVEIAFGETEYTYIEDHPTQDYPNLVTSIDYKVSLSEEDGGLTDEVSATGKGFKNGTSLTVFVDKAMPVKYQDKAGDLVYLPADMAKRAVDEDYTLKFANDAEVPRLYLDDLDEPLTTVSMMVAGTEADVVTAPDGSLGLDEDVICVDPGISSSDVGSCDFTIAHPTFSGGINYVNAKDGKGFYAPKADTFELKASIIANPDSGSPGEVIQVQLVSFSSGPVTKVALGGRDVCPTALVENCNGNVSSQGTGSTRVQIPNWAPAGVQELKIWVGSDSDSTNVTIVGPRIVSTPSTVVANQRVSLVGTGFAPNARLGDISLRAGEVVAPSISIGGETINWNYVNDGRIVSVDDSGNWSASVDLPMVDATTGVGDRLIRITDSKARTGSINVTLAERDFDITPPSGRVGTLAVVRGVGYPGKNDEGQSFTIDVTYKVSERSETRVSVVPDASGRFEVQLRIPTTAAIPSTNQVEVSFDLEGEGSSVTDVKQHMVPEGIIGLSGGSGGPGSSITLSGEGFKTFAPVASVKIGAIDITPAPRPHTDANGMMSFDILIPGLDVGIQTIEVQVGGTTSSTGFTVTASGIASGDITPVAKAFEPLGENLVSVWHFNNDTKIWSFYDPSLTEGNTLTHTITGEPYFIRIKANQEVILNRDTRSLTCVGGNCWNPIVW